MSLEPVELYLERVCTYKSRGRNDAGNRLPGCAVCGRGKYHVDHLGTPPSLNEGGSGMDRQAYQGLKGAWQAAFLGLLQASVLPLDLEAVTVEGQIGFATRKPRDRGNFRWLIEKALGDALVEGGYLVAPAGCDDEDDCFFPVDRYDFGGLEGVHAPGRSWLRLLVFPRAAIVAPMGVKGAAPEPLPLAEA